MFVDNIAALSDMLSSYIQMKSVAAETKFLMYVLLSRLFHHKLVGVIFKPGYEIQKKAFLEPVDTNLTIASSNKRSIINSLFYWGLYSR